MLAQEVAINFVKSSKFQGNGGISGGVAWIDSNNDNFPELVFTNFGLQKNHFYSNNNGYLVISEEDVIHGNFSGIAFGDLNNDGTSEILFSTQQNQNNIVLEKENSEWHIGKGYHDYSNSYGDSYSISLLDLENDGTLEIFVANGLFQSNFAFKNNNNKYENISNLLTNGNFASFGVTTADVNKDGFQDLFFANKGAKNNELYISDGKGLLKLESENIISKEAGNSNGAVWCDFDNDADLDLFVSNGGFSGSGEVDFLYENKGNLLFEKLSKTIITEKKYRSMSPTCGDFDNDGDLDLFITRYKDTPILFQNNGEWDFSQVELNALNEEVSYATGNAMADYDLDGDLDMAIANWENLNNVVFENISQPNQWIRFKLIGVESNSSSIGAKVEIETSDKLQYREIISSHGFRSQNDFSAQAHFGLKSTSKVGRVSISWPSGKQEVFNNLNSNKIYEITEGQGITKVIEPKLYFPYTSNQLVEIFQRRGAEYLIDSVLAKNNFLEPSLKTLIDTGITIGAYGQVIVAKNIFNIANELYPNSSEAVFWISFIDALMGQSEKAKQGFKQSLEMTSLDPFLTPLKKEEIMNSSKFELSKYKNK